MDKQQIKDQIIQIIVEAVPGYIISDEIYNQLIARVDPGRTQETIRKYIRELVNDDDNLIGSSRKGYFFINSELKLNEATSYLLNRIPFLQRRANTLTRLWNDIQR